MTVEHELTRQLDIRFIDARNMANEAKVNLSIHGYATPEQFQEIFNEAVRIFLQRPATEQHNMRRLSATLEAAKDGSMHFSDAGSCTSFGALSDTSKTSWSRKSGKSIFRHQRKQQEYRGCGVELA